jgi:tetratricopeptide (TPR) repeat protein
MALADVLVAERRLADAARVLENAIRAMPGSGQAHYKLGQVSAALQAHPQALDELEEAARLAPLVGLDFLHRAIGELLSIARDFDAVLEPYTRRVELNPNNPDAHLELGETYLRLDRNHEAMAEFHAALMIDPRHAHAYAVLGQAYHRLGQYAEAVLAARRAVALDPTQPDARYTLATSLIRLGRTDEGTQQLETYRQMQAEAEAGRRREYALTALMREVTESAGRGAYDEAAARLRAAIQLEPDEAALHVSLGISLRNAGRLDEAIGAFERAVTLNAGPDVHRYLADVNAALGRSDEARRHRALFERLRKESPLP